MKTNLTLAVLAVLLGADAEAKSVSLAVVPINYSDWASAPDCGPLWQDVFFDGDPSVSSVFRKVSHGRLSIGGRIHSPYTMPDTYEQGMHNGMNPIPSSWNADLLARVIRDFFFKWDLFWRGDRVYDYRRVFYQFPKTKTGSGRGGFTMGGGHNNSIWMWGDCHKEALNKKDWASGLSHEMGHSLGLGHSTAFWRCTKRDPLECGVQTIFGAPEITDPTDLMGGGISLNAPHAAWLGVLAPGNIKLIDASGVYRIDALENDSAGLQVLALHPPGYLSDEYMFISLRLPEYVDGAISAYFKPVTYNKVHVQKSRMAGAAGTPGFGIYHTEFVSMGDFVPADDYCDLANIDVPPGGTPDCDDVNKFTRLLLPSMGIFQGGDSGADPTTHVSVEVLNISNGVATVRVSAPFLK